MGWVIWVTSNSKAEYIEAIDERVVKDMSEIIRGRCCILYGDWGTGKTWAIVHSSALKKGVVLDLENRYEETFRAHPDLKINAYYMGYKPVSLPPNVTLVDKPTLNCYVVVTAYDDNYNFDKIATFNNIIKVLKYIYKIPNLKFVGIDGISDLRRMARDKYEHEISKTAYGPQAWGVINRYVQDVVYPLLNRARISDWQVVMTSHFGWQYTAEGQKVAQIIDTKEYILNNVDEIIEFRRKGLYYYYRKEKSPVGVTGWEAIRIE